MRLVLLAALLCSLLQPAFQLKTLNGIQLDRDIIAKLTPLPTVPPEISRSHRVGAQRYKQFGERCWHMESCNSCVCCGSCTENTFLCDSPPGSVDYCLIYEKLSTHTNIEKINKTVDYKFPADFPDIKFP